MVRVVVAAEEPVTLKYSGETEQLIPEFKLETRQVTFIDAVNPPKGATVMVAFADCPGAGMVMVGGLTVKL
jgi:hypothetical protein